MSFPTGRSLTTGMPKSLRSSLGPIPDRVRSLGLSKDPAERITSFLARIFRTFLSTSARTPLARFFPGRNNFVKKIHY